MTAPGPPGAGRRPSQPDPKITELYVDFGYFGREWEWEWEWKLSSDSTASMLTMAPGVYIYTFFAAKFSTKNH